jgi:hypothetical protein
LEKTTGIQIVADGNHAHQGGATGGLRNLEDGEEVQLMKKPGDTAFNGTHGHGVTDPGHWHWVHVAWNGAHTHPVDYTITRHNGHNHGIPYHSGHTHGIQYAGNSDGVSKNLPPYFALYYIMRTL